jgi:hypothetical protein
MKTTKGLARSLNQTTPSHPGSKKPERRPGTGVLAAVFLSLGNGVGFNEQ